MTSMISRLSVALLVFVSAATTALAQSNADAGDVRISIDSATVNGHQVQSCTSTSRAPF